MRRKDLSGIRFGRLVALEYAGNDVANKVLWRCGCDCGGVKVTRAENLSKGSTNSCGCLANEQKKAAAQMRDHEFTRTKWPVEYRAWNAMIRRCYDKKHPSFSRYAGRGITVCDDWIDSFPTFCADMQRCPEGSTLDRIDNASGYARNNCRWATRKEQANNRRSNTLITCNNETLNISQWSARLGVSQSTIASRLAYGWSDADTITTPVRKHRS